MEQAEGSLLTCFLSISCNTAANRGCVERMVELVGGYPLALQLIGCYLSSRHEEVADYLKWFEEGGLLALLR
jgi:hypothetical protein